MYIILIIHLFFHQTFREERAPQSSTSSTPNVQVVSGDEASQDTPPVDPSVPTSTPSHQSSSAATPDDPQEQILNKVRKKKETHFTLQFTLIT